MNQRSQPASVLSPHTWPFRLSWLPEETYLVGGNVRDALLDRQAGYLDLDFVMPDRAVQTARAIARHHRAGFVLLDADRQIARVVFENATVDFAQQVGSTLEADLERRDFTVNAIAYSPFTEQLYDPLYGYRDLQRQQIRMVAIDNLKEDPLRLLRAYRQSAQLGFALEPKTQAAIRQLAGLLKFVAAERVQSELNYLLGSAKGTPFLQAAWQDGLLQAWLPHADGDRLAEIARIDRAAVDLQSRPDLLEPTKGRNWLKIAKLSRLVAPNAELAESELWRLKYSRVEVQAVVLTLKSLAPLQALMPSAPAAQQYFFFQSAGAVFPAVVLLALANGLSLELIAPLINRYLTPDDPICHPRSLVTGRDLMVALQLAAGPRIGQLLQEIRIAQAEGKITSQAEAIDWARSIAAAES
ncbi:CCA tRNA nucleotidyltransferase [Microcoleus sp. FACHB-1515]|uniref:CCA tRNA nucleotidyltransferase n=1 Tax=Cyanophyceae TaxID=3028117 RepID=UPI001689C304|nr:CCA tRNA nucleotidyltransferase [Microcoleus sp. FACHB-1515]MBD2091190.1 CCA tRNA nucleotidyltransferase [Microcoleus sp. FACHB-1515]